MFWEYATTTWETFTSPIKDTSKLWSTIIMQSFMPNMNWASIKKYNHSQITNNQFILMNIKSQKLFHPFLKVYFTTLSTIIVLTQKMTINI